MYGLQDNSGRQGGPLLAGTRLGSYEVLGGLPGHGTRICRGRHAVLKYEVIIKVLTVDAAAGGTSEQQALALLNSQYVPRLLDSGRLPLRCFGHPYLVLEHSGGPSLARRLQEVRRVAPVDVIVLGKQVALALRDIHAARIAHGDIKPANVALRGGRMSWLAQVIDFGSARLLSEATRGEPVVNRLTPEYAAPELLVGEPATASSDLYGVCAVLFECLSGYRPRRNAAGQLIDSLAELIPVPEDLVQVIERGLAANPAERFGSASELVDALTRVDPQGLEEAAPPSLMPERLDAADLTTIAMDDPAAEGRGSERVPVSEAVHRLMSTGRLDLWVLTGDRTLDSNTTRAALASLSQAFHIVVLEPSRREQMLCALLRGGRPPAVVVYGAAHLALREPLIEHLCRKGETAQLLVLEDSSPGLVAAAVNAGGLDGVVVARDGAAAVVRQVSSLMKRTRRKRRAYDALRLALRDVDNDLGRVQARLGVAI